MHANISPPALHLAGCSGPWPRHLAPRGLASASGLLLPFPHYHWPMTAVLPSWFLLKSDASTFWEALPLLHCFGFYFDNADSKPLNTPLYGRAGYRSWSELAKALANRNIPAVDPNLEFYYPQKTNHQGCSSEMGYILWNNSVSWKPEFMGQANLHVFEDWCGSSISQLRNNLHFPLYPHIRATVKKLAVSPQWTNYGLRIFGYLHPFTDGEFQFAIGSDDNAEFWLSTNENVHNLQLLASVGSTGEEWTAPGEFGKFQSQVSKPVRLAALSKYYFEVLHKHNNVGMDHVEVAWKLTSPGMKFSMIDSQFISLFCNETALKMNEINHIPLTLASYKSSSTVRSSDKHHIDMLRPDPRDTFYKVPLISKNHLRKVLPECSYRPSYLVKGYPLQRYQGLQFVHLSYIYPNDYTRLSHMESENKCFYRESSFYLNRFGFYKYVTFDPPQKRAVEYELMEEKTDVKFEYDVDDDDEKHDYVAQNLTRPVSGVERQDVNIIDNQDENDNPSHHSTRQERKLLSVTESQKQSLQNQTRKPQQQHHLREGFSLTTKAANLKHNKTRFHKNPLIGKYKKIVEVQDNQSKDHYPRQIMNEDPSKYKNTGKGILHGNNELHMLGDHTGTKNTEGMNLQERASLSTKVDNSDMNKMKQRGKYRPSDISVTQIKEQTSFLSKITIKPTHISGTTVMTHQAHLLIQEKPSIAKQRERDTDQGGKTVRSIKMEAGTETNARWQESELAEDVQIVEENEQEPADQFVEVEEIEEEEDQLEYSPIFDQIVNWDQTFNWTNLDFQMLRNDWIDLKCNVSGNLLLKEKEALDVTTAFLKKLNQKNRGTYQLKRIVNVEKRADRVRGSRYLLELELLEKGTRTVRLSEYVFAPNWHGSYIENLEEERSMRNLIWGKRQLMDIKENPDLCWPTGFAWYQKAVVHFIVPVKNQARWVQQFIVDMEDLYRATRDNYFNVIITDYSSEDLDVEAALQRSMIPSYQYVRLQGNFERSAGLQAGIDLVKDQNSIIFLCDLHIHFPYGIIDSIRKHCVKGKMAFAPVVMRLHCGSSPCDPHGKINVTGR
ncbi:beta-1,4-N-acetylgalactosaminyltransferase 3 isoform X2 [Microcaecilia unicolor]|uniref:Beta-1,4-N-acetylgalactosaminyltransferase n=1 Tax=Microcaecilia unicolor TaxID=1415580 RepID=A0A6P7Z276_9AMPH|nr:beta-1,4-N-acetylgalactosaminyltransferase 3 isoform X2 [Microcaecilia unicolor]